MRGQSRGKQQTGRRSMFVRIMFVRMLLRSILRRGRTSSALAAMIVAAAAATAMLNLFVDVQAKFHDEFRNYGANVIVVSKNGEALPENSLNAIEVVAGSHAVAVPFGYVVAHTASGQAVVIAGTDFSAVQNLDRWWSVTQWPQSPRQALVGDRAAKALGIGQQPFKLAFHDKAIELTSAGTLQTGASEDSRIYISLADFENWTGFGPSTVQLAISGSPPEINSTIQKLAAALPAADVRPIRQIMEGEARVLGKTRSTMLYSAILIIVTAALCLFATLLGWVYDRRRDFAVMKALGASALLINGLFAAEALVLGFFGAVVGFVLGIGVAAWIGHSNFHAAITPRLSVLPPVLGGSILLILFATVTPLLLLRHVQPANILRGE
jgi:putative ABC transport system permease protein